MINKLANTQQKFSVLKTAYDQRDVLQILNEDARGSRGRKRSSSKFKNKLRNVRSIQAEAMGMRKPQMQFVDRASTIDVWDKKAPNASMMNA